MGSTDSGRLDYQSAGVDLSAGDAVVDAIGAVVRRTHGPRVLRGLGHFGGFFRVGPTVETATLVASTDSVGTKLKVAILAGRHEGIGYDLVHHCINDIIACGARPLFFLDYYATGDLDPAHATGIVAGIASACEAHGIALIGGETAELPGIYAGDNYDVVGFIVGMVDAGHIIDGSAMRPGDIVLGLPSSGFHTNGYSLVRAALRLNDLDRVAARSVLEERLGPAPERTLADQLLEPHRCYAEEVRALIDAGIVRALAHITGGGIAGNVARVVPGGLAIEFDPATWSTPLVMEYVIARGGIARSEAFRAFNMGIGYVIVVNPADVAPALELADDALVIGRVVEDHSGSQTRIVGLP